nr:hypothetical protein [Mesorhizobium tianshanense]
MSQDDETILVSTTLKFITTRRRAWFDGQLDLDPAKLVFIDESVLQRHGRSSL